MSEGARDRRWAGAGVLFVILLVVLLAAPLWTRGNLDHPLAARAEFDSCPLLPPPPSELGHLRVQRLDPRSSICSYTDGDGKQQLVVTISTTRQMSQERPTDSQHMFELWLAEVHASEGPSQDAPGPWRRGATWRSGSEQALLFEDGGVLVELRAATLDAAALRRHAERVQQKLRGN